MTSISPARSRPPPLNTQLGPYRTHSRSASQLTSLPSAEEKKADQDDDLEFIHERPAKRRKTSSASLGIPASIQQTPPASAQLRYLAAPWSTVLRMSTESHAERATDAVPPPLPDRPWGTMAPRDGSLQDTRPPVRVRKNVAVPNTPDSIEIPSNVPLFERKRHVDYFPWTGKHPEDVLSEAHVKQGYFDHPPNPPEKETNTAKGQLYNAFKHKSGLESLSAIFSLVLESKSKHGAFSSASTFKGPPPRVTLTEAKRKSWISDLANPDVPLRRLSKTIPQGIRGSSLLEQCLQNNIPLSRAIWFTKCVGANEIRTLKRKGVNPSVSQGAEIKWLREWTVNIQQFIESVLAQCGQNKWKERIRYSITFAARLYLENLLDRDHYLDWILKSLATASSNHWPFWLMMIHLHRIDLIAFRKKGKQLAENLVLKYNSAQAAPGDTLQPLALNLAAAIRPLVATRPNCFLMPERWVECSKALTACLDLTSDVDRRNFEYLKSANERASGMAKRAGNSSASPFEKVVDTLDSFGPSMSVSELYESLCKACADQETLMFNCLEWCVSRYRDGPTRVYLCARLYRKLRKQGCDVDQVLLDFIFNKVRTSAIDDTALKHLVSELSRSGTFPISKYMQWLSVRGMPRPGSVSDCAVAADISVVGQDIIFQASADIHQLLTEVCLLRHEEHLINLRNTLLSKAGFDEEVELTASERLRSVMMSALADTKSTSAQRSWSHAGFGRLPWAVRTRMSYWLRTEIATLAKTTQVEILGKPPLPGTRSLTMGRFLTARALLEEMGDIAILADVLHIVSSSKQEDILAAAVDTVNMHCSALSAIGALEPLQLAYGQVYVALRTMKTAMPLYATALINLCQQRAIKVAPVRALQHDFIRGDRGRAVTACSPFSDGVAESLQQAGATFHDDFEAILQTESNMNDQTMIRLFKVLIERIEKTQHSDDAAQQLPILCQLLARLKLCQKSQGELLVNKWVTRLCSSQQSSMSPQLLFNLTCTRCVSLETVLDVCQPLPAASVSRQRLYSHIRRAILNEPETDIDGIHWYGFRLAVSKLVLARPVEVLEIIGTDETGKCSATSTRFTLISAVISNPDLIKSLSKPAWLVVSQTLSEYLSEINSTDPVELQAKALAVSADPLSLPYCCLRMRMLCQNAATKNDERIQDDIATTLCAVASDPTASLSSSPRTFQSLLRATGPVVSAKVRSNIEQSFFNALPKFLQSKGLAQPPLPGLEETERTATALQQVILVSTDTAGTAQPSSVGALIEKLTIYMKSLGSTTNTVHPPAGPLAGSTGAPPPSTDDQFYEFLVNSLDHLDFLLQMLCIKRTAINVAVTQPSTTTAKATQQDQVKLVGLLITIGTHGVWSAVLTATGDRARQDKIRSTIDFAFDVAATLADDMSDESRTFCARILKDKIKDERVRWVLGCINSFGSVQSHDVSGRYQVASESRGVLGEWKAKTWEMLESGASSDSCLGLGLFGARRV